MSLIAVSSTAAVTTVLQAGVDRGQTERFSLLKIAGTLRDEV